MEEEGDSPRDINSSINGDDKHILDMNKDLFKEFRDINKISQYQRRFALSRLINEYNDMIQCQPFIDPFKRSTHLTLDSKLRIIDMENLSFDRPIYSSDFRQAIAVLENPAFNSVFHDELKKKLVIKPKSRKEYELDSMELLYEAYSLYQEGHYHPAFVNAATAFESLLQGFLKDKNILTEDNLSSGIYTDEYGHEIRINVSQMTGKLFDYALKQDPSYLGKDYQIFNKTIRNKIIKNKDSNIKAPSNNQIRNSIVHSGAFPGGDKMDYYTSRFGCDVYAEAIKYILDKGWLSKDSPRLSSDILSWARPGLSDRISHAPQNRAVFTLKKGLEDLEKYMEPHHIKRYKQSIPSYSWANDVRK